MASLYLGLGARQARRIRRLAAEARARVPGKEGQEPAPQKVGERAPRRPIGDDLARFVESVDPPTSATM